MKRDIATCLADEVQTVSGCTPGNNVLVFKDFGKMAVTFARRDGQNRVG